MGSSFEGDFFVKAGILAGIISLMIHGLADFNFAIPGNALAFIFLLASACRLSGGMAEEKVP